jgi:hypothetical protein
MTCLPLALRVGVLSFVFLFLTSARAETPKADAKKDPPEIAGKSEYLRSVPKHFATLKAVDPAKRSVTLLIEGDSMATVWELTPDAEVKVAGWWARLEYFTIGDRVWAWFETDRDKKPVAVFMLCDELTEQDMHLAGRKVEAVDAERITLKPGKGKSRELNLAGAEVLRGKEKAGLDSLKKGEELFVQSAGESVRLVLDSAALEARRAAQKEALRQRWAEEGLPGSLSVLHRFTGEFEVMLDHEAMRWARSLRPGDKVTLPFNAVVRHVKPWRERTQVRLVASAADLAGLKLGHRTTVRMTPPSIEVENAVLPPDIDQPRATKEERIEWFLASIYCTCKVGGDGCTGHVYTLASCNPNACGKPNQMRKQLAREIDRGLSDREIFEELVRDNGPELLRPHLLP